MARAAVLGRLNWHVATVADVVVETARVHSLVFKCETWPGHLAGQHVDIRLTAEDGYQAQRSYSIASAPEENHLVLTVERLDDGEVSPYLVEVLQPGDPVELRGPIGGYFVWDVSHGGPLMLLAGGSGVVPMRSMLHHRANAGSDVPARLLYSSRSLDEVIYREEFARLAADDAVDVRLTLTRRQPPGWEGFSRRIDHEMVSDVFWPPSNQPLIYICGPNGFVETAANILVDLGHAVDRIKTERFGPTG